MPSTVETLVLSQQMRLYQRVGVAWAVARFQRDAQHAVGLIDEPGLGKTLQALAIALALDAKRILVVAPAGARRVWLQEIQRWLPQWAARVFIVEPGIALRDHEAALDRSPLILLVAYDSLSERTQHLSWAAAIEERRWDLGVLDEAHFLKNPSNRTLAVYGRRGSDTGIHAACARVLLLTGTLTPNHAGELYQHMRALWPATLVVPGQGVVRGTNLVPAELHARMLTQAEFEERVTHYRDHTYGRQIIGSKNQAWLRERLGPMLLRRTKAEVLPELPPLIAQDVPLALSAHKDIAPSLWRQGVLLWDRAKRLTDDAFIAALHRQQADGNGALTTLRRELGLLKVQPAFEWIVERLSCGTAKMLVFVWHVDVAKRLYDLLREFNPELIIGSTSPQARVEAQHRFQHRPNARVFIGQILAAGVAITLTAASEVAIVEPSWVPGENRQAIDRAHRLGQRDSVLASFLFLPNTLDQRIMQVFRRKAADIVPLLQDDSDKEPIHVACSR